MSLREEQGARLALIRGQESQAVFAPKIGIHKNTLGNWERGEREIGAEALKRLADLGWSPLWLLTGLEPMRLPKGMPADAATDNALIVARNDQVAEVRRDRAIRDWSSGFREGRQTAPDGASQAVQREALTMALQLAAEALGDKVLPPAKHAELVSIVYDCLVEGLPEAKVLRIARVAAV